MIETFVLMELARQLTWCQERAACATSPSDWAHGW